MNVKRLTGGPAHAAAYYWPSTRAWRRVTAALGIISLGPAKPTYWMYIRLDNRMRSVSSDIRILEEALNPISNRSGPMDVEQVVGGACRWPVRGRVAEHAYLGARRVFGEITRASGPLFGVYRQRLQLTSQVLDIISAIHQATEK